MLVLIGHMQKNLTTSTKIPYTEFTQIYNPNNCSTKSEGKKYEMCSKNFLKNAQKSK